MHAMYPAVLETMVKAVMESAFSEAAFARCEVVFTRCEVTKLEFVKTVLAIHEHQGSEAEADGRPPEPRIV